MINKTNVLLQAEEIIKPLALEHVPQDSDVEAVIDQWLHAIATDSQFYCNPEISKPEQLKESVISQLQQNGLYATRKAFFNEVFSALKLKPDFDGKFRFIDLFAGIGGVRLGFQQNGGICVFSSEFDKNAQQTYKLNHGDFPFGDITQVSKVAENIPEHDILLGGFPCQAFSVAGYRQGFEDEKGRGNLFFDIYEILKAKRPKAFLLENVKNLQGHDKGKTFTIIKNYLEDLGYSVTHRVLNSMEYGNVPQTRERIYIVGFLENELSQKFSWPEKQNISTSIQDILESKVDEQFYYEKYACHDTLKEQMTRHDTVYQWRRHYVRENKSNVCPTLTANMGTGGHNVPLILDQNKRIRKLTPKECSYVQGFPGDFQIPNIANSHLYKQFGNSVTVPVIERIAKEIVKVLKDE